MKILIGCHPQWRGQPMGTFRVVFSAGLYGRAVAGKADPKPIWRSPKKP